MTDDMQVKGEITMREDNGMISLKVILRFLCLWHTFLNML
jgi:hypothetical protein